jgi:hypothetical protein
VLFLLFANPFPEIWDKVPKKFSEPLNRLTVDYPHTGGQTADGSGAECVQKLADSGGFARRAVGRGSGAKAWKKRFAHRRTLIFSRLRFPISVEELRSDRAGRTLASVRLTLPDNCVNKIKGEL